MAERPTPPKKLPNRLPPKKLPTMVKIPNVVIPNPDDDEAEAPPTFDTDTSDDIDKLLEEYEIEDESPTETDTMSDKTDTKETTEEYIPRRADGTPIPQSKGTGRKLCEACGKYIAPAFMVCPNPACGHEFVKKEKPTKTTKRVEGGRNITETPAKEKDGEVKKSELAVWNVINHRGYKIKVFTDLLNPKEQNIECDKEIRGLVDFLQSKTVELLQSSPSIKYAIGLDDIFDLLKIPHRK